jgi:hypothetical protein
MVPDQGLDQIRQWLDRRSAEIPESARDRIRYELDAESHAAVIIERRPPWRADLGPEWSRLAIARLRYSRTNGDWALYWFDRNGHHHRYDALEPTADLSVLLDEIDADPTAIFWG